MQLLRAPRLCVIAMALCAINLVAFAQGQSKQTAAGKNSGRALPAELIIPGDKIYPESLTSTADGRVIIGSISTRTIFVVKPGATTAEAWIQPDKETSLGVFGVFADDKSNTLWACLTPVPGREATQGQSALAAFDLQTGAPKGRYPLPTAGAFCNDIAVGDDGATYITDSRNMEVDRLQNAGHQLQTWAGHGGFGPATGFIDGIAVLANRLFVNTLNTGKLFAVSIEANGSAGAITEVKLDRSIERPDGMRSFGRDGVLIIESGGSGRLSLTTAKYLLSLAVRSHKTALNSTIPLRARSRIRMR